MITIDFYGSNFITLKSDNLFDEAHENIISYEDKSNTWSFEFKITDSDHLTIGAYLSFEEILAYLQDISENEDLDSDKIRNFLIVVSHRDIFSRKKG